MLYNFFTRLHSQMHLSARPDPGRAWLVLIGFFGIALASLLVYNAWLFDRVAGGDTLSGAAAPSTDAVSRSALSIVRTIFDERAGEEMKYVTGTYRFPDPSQ